MLTCLFEEVVSMLTINSDEKGEKEENIPMTTAGFVLKDILTIELS